MNLKELLESLPKESQLPGYYQKESLKKLKEYTKNIKFNCTFDDKGSCGKCTFGGNCCSMCNNNFGYFSTSRDTITPYRKRLLLSLWDDKEGFRGTNGCRIPRKHRSITCLTFSCIKRNSVERHLLGALYDVATSLVMAYNFKKQINELKSKRTS